MFWLIVKEALNIKHLTHLYIIQLQGQLISQDVGRFLKLRLTHGFFSTQILKNAVVPFPELCVANLLSDKLMTLINKHNLLS